MIRNARKHTTKTLAAAAAAALALAAAPATLAAQDGGAGDGALVIRGGTIHPVSGASFVGTVVVENGRIAAVDTDVAAPAGARVIDAHGLHVYPGLFDAATQLGIIEIGQTPVTADFNELGDYTPHVEARTAINPASAHIPVARSNGITHAMSLPSSGRFAQKGFPGQGSIVHLDGWTVEEMDIAPGAVMAMNWPTIRMTTGGGWWGGGGQQRSYREAREEYEKAVHEITAWLDAARSYDRSVRGGAEIRRDLRLESLARVVRGEVPVMAAADTERDIRNLVEYAGAQGLRLILASGRDSYMVADLLAEKDIPVILRPTQSLPGGADRPYDESYRTPAILHEAGVRFAIATFNASDVRTLPYEAAMGVPFGLPRDAALRAITLAPAEILGLGNRLGSIDAGKVANLIVTDGDPLEFRSRIVHLIIDGREVTTMNKHRELYERWRSRPAP